MTRYQIVAAGFAVVMLLAHRAAAEAYDYEGFQDIHAMQGVDVLVTIGSDYAVELVSGDAQRARVELNDDKLTLGRQRNVGINIDTVPSHRLVYEVTLPELSAAETSSGAELVIEGLKGGDLALDASSGSDLQASGRCDRLQASTSSGAVIKALELSCAQAELSASSGSKISVTVTEELSAHASSGGSIRGSGNPSKQDVRTSSGGRVDI
ncbi:MAG: DUF2807 domain-containing protein [Pseudomonadota bacterium]